MAEVRAEESEMAKELRELKKLRDDGVIDKSLFMEKSRQVLGLPALPAKRAPPADAADTPPKKAKPPSPSATPPPAQPASIDLTNDTEAPPPAAAAPPVAPTVAPPAAAPPAAPPAPAIVQPPKGISTNQAAFARYPAHERRLLRARDEWEAFLSADNVDSGDDDESPQQMPQQMTGYFPAWENAKYLELLNKYGEPKKANPEALRAFSQEFCYRKKASITSHPSYFNKGAYDAWRAANGGKWVGFTWTAPNGL